MPFGWTPPIGVTSPVEVFAGYLLLDAWTGNVDRHHENWALVYRVADGMRALSPTFDHASALGSHETDVARSARLTSSDPGYRVESYVARAKVRSPFYASATAPAGLSPLDAMRLWNERASIVAWIDRLRDVTAEEIESPLHEAPESMMFGPSRDFAAAILEVNRKRILALA
jgi:hypothetical protein